MKMKKQKMLLRLLVFVMIVGLFQMTGMTSGVFAEEAAAPEGTTILDGQETTEPEVSIEDRVAGFVDVDAQEWYYDGVRWALEKGVMNGTGENTFEPLTPTTRAMIVTMLWRMEGSPQADADSLNFQDVPDGQWYTDAIRWAASTGIVNGYTEEIFGTNEPVTREQLAAILYRSVKAKSLGFTGTWSYKLNYDDADQVSDYAYEPLCWMTMKGIIQGMSQTALSPKGNAVRAQIATILMRLDQFQAQSVYLTLVNKTNKLPDHWLDLIKLETAQNSMGREFQVESEALKHFEKLREAMLSEGIDIELDSTYRSVQRQEELWAEFEREYGLEYCQKYVAVPGFSEHHTGLAIDVCLIKDGKVIDDNDAMIAEKEIFAKVHEKLADYGFILRYLQGKEDVTGYAYEPWHFRYVGETAAREIMEKGITLEEYLDQKTITPFLKMADYQNWAKEEGYPSGLIVAQGVDGINQDYFHTPADSEACSSGKIVIGDSRCCQLGIYEQRSGKNDFATYAVWGGHYAKNSNPPLMTEELKSEVESCFQEQIRSCGKSVIYFFATVNDYDFQTNENNRSYISDTISAAESFSAMSYEYNGSVYHPEVIVIGFDGGPATGKVLRYPAEEFNRYVDDYNQELRAAVAGSDPLKASLSSFTTVPEIVGGKASFITDGLHYSDDTLDKIVKYIVSH